MPRLLTKSLLSALGLALVTAFAFDSFSYGVAHANPVLLLVFFGAGIAYARDLPGIHLPGAVFVYQLVYYTAWALVIAAAIGLARARKERLRIENRHGNAS